MTENEAIESLDNLHYKIIHTAFCNKVREKEIEALCMAKEILEEVQAYRAIGTVAEIKKTVAFLEDTNHSIVDELKLLNQYREIGTVAEIIDILDNVVEIRVKAIDEAKETASKAICIGCGYLKGHNCTYKGSNCGVSKPMLENVVKALEQMKKGGAGDGKG